jgi:hypothetical protein
VYNIPTSSVYPFVLLSIRMPPKPAIVLKRKAVKLPVAVGTVMIATLFMRQGKVTVIKFVDSITLVQDGM